MVRPGILFGGADSPPPVPLRALIAVNDAEWERRLATDTDIRFLAVVRDVDVLKRHIDCGGASFVVVGRSFAQDARAVLTLIPAAWAVLLLCGAVGPAALRWGLHAARRPGTRALFGHRVSSQTLRRVLHALAADLAVLRRG